MSSFSDNNLANNAGACFAFLLFFVCSLSQSDASLSSKTEPTKPALQLANVYHSDISLADYWVSEKLDGVRALWDGKRLISKQGNTYHAPAWFLAGLPDFALDGELWLDRNEFDKLSGIVRKQEAIDEEWALVSYQVFDLPDYPAVFDERLAILKTYFEENETAPWVYLVPQFKVNSPDTLNKVLETVEAQKGEGLMLHYGRSFYHAGRDDDLLKLKSYQDAEALVLQHLPGKGKHQGKLGSIFVKALNGEQKNKQFKIGTGFSDIERASPPEVGSVITYKYVGLTSNKLPRFASFLRSREDYAIGLND